MCKKQSRLILSLIALLTSGTLAQAESAPDAFAQNQKLARGVNILGYDPLWRSRDQARFKAEYFQKLKIGRAHV